MKTLKDFTDAEQGTVLKFTQMLVGEIPMKKPVAFSVDMTDDESEEQVTQQARDLAERQKRNGGRIYRDDTDEGIAIREQVRKHLRRKKLLPND